MKSQISSRSSGFHIWGHRQWKLNLSDWWAVLVTKNLCDRFKLDLLFSWGIKLEVNLQLSGIIDVLVVQCLVLHIHYGDSAYGCDRTGWVHILNKFHTRIMGDIIPIIYIFWRLIYMRGTVKAAFGWHVMVPKNSHEMVCGHNHKTPPSDPLL